MQEHQYVLITHACLKGLVRQDDCSFLLLWNISMTKDEVQMVLVMQRGFVTIFDQSCTLYTCCHFKSILTAPPIRTHHTTNHDHALQVCTEWAATAKSTEHVHGHSHLENVSCLRGVGHQLKYRYRAIWVACMRSLRILLRLLLV